MKYNKRRIISLDDIVQKEGYKYRKDKGFDFKENIAKVNQMNKGLIHLKRSYNNIFITLTDIYNQVIMCKTAGSCISGRNKRRKRTSFAINEIVDRLKLFLDYHEIQELDVISRLRNKPYTNKVLARLFLYGMKISDVIYIRKIPHNGMKGRNVRRL